MRAAELLAEMLLSEGRVFAIVYGPNIPPDGYWLAGDSLRDMVQKLATGLGSNAGQQTQSFIDTLISSRYELVTSIDGRAIVYGLDIPELSPKAAQILGITATTPVYHQQKYQGITPATPANSTGREAFGLAMTPQEKEVLAQQKAQAKAQSKQKWHDLTPDEEAEFNQWAQQSGKRPSGLASTWQQQQALAAPAAPAKPTYRARIVNRQRPPAAPAAPTASP